MEKASVERIKAIANTTNLIAVDFLDADGGFVSANKQVCVRVELHFSDGTNCWCTWEEFNSFDDFKFTIGTRPH